MPSTEGCWGGGRGYDPSIKLSTTSQLQNLEANTVAVNSYFIGLETLFCLTNVFLTVLLV